MSRIFSNNIKVFIWIFGNMVYNDKLHHRRIIKIITYFSPNATNNFNCFI